MFALRVPFAAVSGALLAAAVFLGLFNLVNVPFEMQPTVTASDIIFTPQRRDTPVKNKRDPKIERTPPPVVPVPGRPTTATGVTGDASVTFERVRVDVVGPGRGPAMGTDRDVLPLVRVAPEYPPRALANGTEGWVQVRFAITPTGTVRAPVVVASEPGSVFDDAALKAIARWRYNPRVEDGQAVERVGLETVIRFTLEN